MPSQIGIPQCFFCFQEIDTEANEGEYRIGGRDCCTECYKNEEVQKGVQRSNNYCRVAETLAGESAEQLKFIAGLHKKAFNTNCTCPK